MQAEWEELARRNWLEETEGQRPIPPAVSPAEKVKKLSDDVNQSRRSSLNIYVLRT